MAIAIHTVRNRESGATIHTVDNRDGTMRAGRKRAPAGWYAVCETHHSRVLADTRRQAALLMAHPTQWCEDCKEAGQPRQRRNTKASTPTTGASTKNDKVMRKAYEYVLNNWAVGAGDVAKHLRVERKVAVRILNLLKRKGLLAAEDLGDGVVWQTYYDVENDEEAYATGMAAFEAAMAP